MAVVAGVGAACGGEDDATGTTSLLNDFEVPDAGDVAEEQRQYFADGVVSVTEYQEAFSRFRQCASDVGGVVTESSRDPVTGVIEYSSSAALQASGAESVDEFGNLQPAAESAVNDCYQRFFDLTEITFQLSDPTVQAAVPDQQIAMFLEIAAPCLEANGVGVPSDLQYGTPEYQDLTARFGELNSTGRCTSTLTPATTSP